MSGYERPVASEDVQATVRDLFGIEFCDLMDKLEAELVSRDARIKELEDFIMVSKDYTQIKVSDIILKI